MSWAWSRAGAGGAGREARTCPSPDTLRITAKHNRPERCDSPLSQQPKGIVLWTQWNQPDAMVPPPMDCRFEAGAVTYTVMPVLSVPLTPTEPEGDSMDELEKRPRPRNEPYSVGRGSIRGPPDQRVRDSLNGPQGADGRRNALGKSRGS